MARPGQGRNVGRKRNTRNTTRPGWDGMWSERPYFVRKVRQVDGHHPGRCPPCPLFRPHSVPAGTGDSAAGRFLPTFRPWPGRAFVRCGPFCAGRESFLTMNDERGHCVFIIFNRGSVYWTCWDHANPFIKRIKVQTVIAFSGLLPAFWLFIKIPRALKGFSGFRRRVLQRRRDAETPRRHKWRLYRGSRSRFWRSFKPRHCVRPVNGVLTGRSMVC
jgi:hypothetical protein